MVYKGILNYLILYLVINKLSFPYKKLIKMKESETPIPEEKAIKICNQIREKNKQKRISFSKLQCWGCMKFSKYENRGSCIYGKPETLRGCQLVNNVFDKKRKVKK